MSAAVELRFAPPTDPWSANARMHWTKERKLAKAWRAAACRAAQHQLGAGVQLPPSLVEVHIPFRRNARRDPHNYTSTVVKRIVDGLGPATTTRRKGSVSHHPGAGLWPDDTAEFVRVLDPVLYVGDEVVVRITPR